MGRGDLVLKHVNLGGHRHLVLDVAVNHEIGGDHLADVSQNGALRDSQQSRILESTARTKVDSYRAGYAAIKYAFLPCVIPPAGASTASSCASSTSSPTAAPPTGYKRHSNDEPSEEAFKLRRGQNIVYWNSYAV